MNKYHAFLLTIAITNLLSPVHAGVSAATGLGFLVTAGLGYKGYQSYQKMSSAARRFKKIASSERGEMLKKARSEFHRYLASGSVAACITLVLLFKVLSDRDAEKDRVAIALAQATREQADRERAEREQAEALSKLEASKAEEEAAAEKLRTMRNKNEWEIRSVCHAEDENTDELERVIRKAEEIDLYHDYRTEALRDAMRFERARIINYLLDPNSSVHVQIDGKSLMEIALQSGEPEMVCLAFDYGAEYSPSMEQGKKSTIMNRALMKKDLALARKLAKHGVMPNNNSMAIAVAAGNIEAVDFLIKEGMLSINAINEDGDTPLLACIKKAPLKFFDAICLALKRGANVEIRDRSGFTPLVIAARGGRYDLVWILFRKGNPDINARADGLTALGHAVRGGHVAVAKYLLKRGAIVDDSIRDELARLLPGDDVEVA